MPEATSNVELAHKIHEHGHHPSPTKRREQWFEIVEAVVLGIVAVATAWSGYQAAKWDALSNENYLLAARATVLSEESATLAGQDRLYDTTTFNGWVAAKVTDRDKLAAFYQRRFRPEYATAFAAWWKLDPIHNPSAPAGPIFMKEYTNANSQESAKFAEEAKRDFDKGIRTRETGDKYVKVTVLLATVLLLTAISQRFAIFGPRVAVVAVAFVLLIISSYWILTLPRVVEQGLKPEDVTSVGMGQANPVAGNVPLPACSRTVGWRSSSPARRLVEKTVNSFTSFHFHW
jgi:hypothetical protein